MSKQIDERVVEMRFDNKQFEKNVQTSMTTIDKFKEKLKFKGASDGLSDLSKSAKKVDLSAMGDSADKVGLKFNALFSIADQVFRNITNSAMMYGKKIVSAFAFDPIKTGFQEYETQINSVQTILANTESKGSTLQDVNSALAELNTYADKTIYNFTEMTRNIGTFTAAGVDLKTSVAAIKGIANLAAVSGSTSQQASTAMYQLSQALSSGTVKLMDWNSVVNAGMGGQVFQDSLKETARVHGIAIDDMIEKNGSFRETLQEGWLTSEILTETLSKFTGDLSESQLKAMGYTDEQIEGILKLGKTANDAATKVKTFTQLFDTLKEAAQSGWTKSWEILIGDFGEAKELLTEISDLVGGAIGDSSDKRNEILMGGLSTGWKQLLNEGIHDAAGFEEMVSNVAKEHGVDIASMITDEKSFQDVLKESLASGKLTGDTLSESISKFTEKVSAMSAEELEAAGYTKDQIKTLKELDAKVKDGTISMERFAELIVRPSGRELLIESLRNAIKGLGEVLAPIKGAFEEVFPAFTGEQLYTWLERLRDLTAQFKLTGDQANRLKSTFKAVFSVIKMGINIGVDFTKGVFSLLKAILPIGDGLLATTGSLGEFITGIANTIGEMKIFSNLFGTLASIIAPAAKGIKNLLTGIFEGFGGFKGIVDLLQTVTNSIGSLFNNLASSLDGVVGTMNGGLLTVVILGLKKFIDNLTEFTSDLKASSFLDSVKNILDGVGESLKAFTTAIKAEALKSIAISIGILAAALWVLSAIDPEKMGTALAAITILFIELTVAMKSFQKIFASSSLKSISATTSAMIKLSIALLLLAAALKIMSGMSWKEMGVGLISLTVGLGALVAAVRLLPEKKVNGAARSIRKLSSAILVMALAIKIMSTMSWKEMGVGLISMGVGLGILVGAVRILPKDVSAKTAGIFVLASAMVVLGVALKIMSSMNWEELARGLIAMSVSLGVVVGAMRIMPSGLSGAFAMFIISAALIELSVALKIMSSMSWDEVGRGLVTLAGSLAILTGAMWGMKHAIKGAAAMLVVAAAVLVLAPALKMLGGMSVGGIIKSLASLAGAFIILGVAAKLLSPLAGTLLKVGAAVAIFGVGMVAIGAGLMLVGAGLGAVGAGLLTLVASLTACIGDILKLLPEIIQIVGELIIGLCNVIKDAAPTIAETILVVIVEVLKALVTYTPQVVDSIMQFLIAIIQGIANRLPELIGAVVNLVMALFTGTIDALKNVDPAVLLEGIKAVGILSALMIALSVVSGFIPGAIAGVLGMGVVIAELALVFAALGKLMLIPGITDMIGEGGKILQAVGTAIGQFIGGLAGGMAKGFSSALPEIGASLSQFMNNVIPFINGVKMVDGQVLASTGILAAAIIALSVAEFINGVASFFSIGSSLSDLGTQLSQFMLNAMPFITGSKLVDPAAAEGVKALAEMVLILTAAGLLEGIASWLTGGTDFGEFGEKLAEFGVGLKAYAESIKGIDCEAIAASAEAGKALAQLNAEIPNMGGVVSWFTGENDFAKFGEGIVAFGSALKLYSASIVGIDCEAITASAQAGKALAQLNAEIPNMGGVVSWFTGDNDFETFGTKIVAFGKSLKEYAGSVVGIDCAAITASVEAGKALAALNVEIPNMGGVVSWFTGDNDFETFGTKIAAFGEGLKAYGASILGVDTAAIIASVEAGKALAQLNAAIPNMGGVVSWFTGDNDFETFGSKIKSFGTALADFAVNVSAASADQIKKAASLVKSVTSVVNNAKGLGDFDVETFGAKIASFGGKIYDFTTNLSSVTSDSLTKAINKVQDCVDMCSSLSDIDTSSMTSFGEALAKLATDGIKKFSSAIKSNGSKTDAKDAVQAVVDAAVKKIKSKDNYTKFKNAGKYCVQGFAKGIDDNKHLAGGAGTRLGNYAYQKAKEAIDSNSPSKKFAELGLYSVLGFAKGITDNLGDARKSAVGLGNAVLTATQDYLGIHSPSLVFNKEVGRYIVQGIAEGIKDETEAEKQAREKAEKIVNAFKEAFQKEIDKYNTGKSIADSELELWTLLNPKATDEEVYNKQLAVANEDLARQNHVAKLLHDQWRQAEDLCKQGLMTMDEVNNFYDQYVKQMVTAAQASDKVVQVKTDWYDSVVESLELDQSVDDAAYEFWKSVHKDASDEELDRQLESYLRGKLERQTDIHDADIQAWRDAVDRYGEESAEAKAAEQKMAKSATDRNNTIDAIKQIAIDRKESERKEFRNLRDLAIDNDDKLYQIWEKTLGRDATDEEKEARKLVSLTTKATNQTQLLNSARVEWLEAKAKFGEGSLEEQEAYQKYLDNELNLVTTQGEILDIQEAQEKRRERLIDKQNLAKSEYDEYIKKYKKYYEENGKTLDELEKDAKLVSGYDPSKVVEANNKKTTSAMVTGLTNLGTAAAAGVGTATSAMTSAASTFGTNFVSAISSQSQSWVDAGTTLANAFLGGLTSNTDKIKETGKTLANATLEAIQESLDSDSRPVITPVLDLSTVNQQLASLNAVTSARQAAGISSSMSRDTSTNNQNGDEKLTGSNIYNYVQNNYSPKALSRTEIFRDTKTLLATKKGA